MSVARKFAAPLSGVSYNQVDVALQPSLYEAKNFKCNAGQLMTGSKFSQTLIMSECIDQTESSLGISVTSTPGKGGEFRKTQNNHAVIQKAQTLNF